MAMRIKRLSALVLIITLISSYFAGIQVQASEPGDPALLAWYKLDGPYDINGVQTAEDSSGNGNHSVSAVGTWETEGGVDGGAFSLNGTTDVVKLNKGGDQDLFLKGEFSEFSVSMWFKANDTAARQVLFERGGNSAGLALQLNENRLEAAVPGEGAPIILSVDFTDTVSWHEVMVSFDYGLFSLYLDGELVKQVTAPYDTVASALNESAIGARIGVDAFGGSKGGAWFNGMIDDVKLYSAAVAPEPSIVDVSGISFEESELTLSLGASYTLTALLQPANATNKGIQWSTSNDGVISLTSDNSLQAGLEAKGIGTATVTATTDDGNYTASIAVTVNPPAVEGVALNTTELSLQMNQTTQLTPVIVPAYALNQNVSWSSSNTTIASVDEQGIVTAHQPGTATITVTTEDGGYTATSVITVEAIPVEGLSISRTQMTLAVGAQRLLVAAVEPADATNQEVLWSTDNASVATVDPMGRVTAARPGTARITVQSLDGGFLAECDITVNVFALNQVENYISVDSGWGQGQKATVYDGTIEKYNGYYYMMGTGTMGSVYRSKDMIHWESPYEIISDDPATIPPAADPLYSRYGASDLFYHNGVMFYSFNGTAMVHGDPSSLDGTPDFRHSFWDKRFDLGIDPQLFVAHNGDLLFLRKVNPNEPDPNTGADKPERAGAWIWKVQSFFNESGNPGRSDALETVHTQPGHWGNMNHYNFEGPELYYHNGQYYMLFVGNQFYPETGLYETGVAQADSYEQLDNADKYAGKLLARNLEELILKYNVLLPTAEHGGQPYTYTFETPQAGWGESDYDTSAWIEGEGGFGWPSKDRAEIPSVYNNNETNAARIWGTETGPESMWARRTVELEQIPDTTALRYRLEGYGDIYVNGQKLVSFEGQQRAYKMVEVPRELLKTGQNVIAVEISRAGGPELNSYHLDFGLYDTKGGVVEPDIIGPSQPNVIKGPNGFETWITYKAFWNSINGQGKDRLYFWGEEMVADGPTSADTPGLHPDAWKATFHDRFDSSESLEQYEDVQSDVTVEAGALSFNTDNGYRQMLIKDYKAENVFIETNIRFSDNDFGDEAQAGIAVWNKDADNYVNVMIDRNDKTLEIPYRINGVSDKVTYALPSTFSFLHDDERAADFGEQYHTLKIYKNGSKLFAELDHYTLNDDKPVLELDAMTSAGKIGLVSNAANATMDNVTVTAGWSEYGEYFNGWDEAWTITEAGLQAPAAGEALTVKGDPLLENELSVNIHTGTLPETGEAGVALAYVDDQNYVIAVTNYETRQYELYQVVNGQKTLLASASTARDTIYGHSNYDGLTQSSYEYLLRGEAEVSMAKMLWFYGQREYLNQLYQLPDSASADFGFDSWQGDWTDVAVTYEDKGRGDYHIAEFAEHVKTDKIRLNVPSDSNRPFSFVLREEISSQNFLKTVRSKGRLYVWANNRLILEAADPFAGQAARMGLYTDNVQAVFNAFTGFDVSGQIAHTETQPGDDENEIPSVPQIPAGSGVDNEMTSKLGEVDVTPEEGGLLTSDKGIELMVPEGAVTDNRTLSIALAKPDQVQPNGTLQAMSPTFELSSTGDGRFSKHLELTFDYDPKWLQEEQQAAVYYYHEEQKRWIYVGGIEREKGKLSILVNHFTKFAVFAHDRIALSDVSRHRAEESINRLVGMEAVSGYPDGTFRPNENVTRAGFAKMAAAALGLHAVGSSTSFADDSDIPSWAKPFVQAATEAGFIQGVERNDEVIFDADRFMTRAEISVMAARILQKEENGIGSEESDLSAYKDLSIIPDWALDAMEISVGAGILNGYEDNTLKPNGVVSRDEAAAILYRLLERLYL